jgi:hypothetical protein
MCYLKNGQFNFRCCVCNILCVCVCVCLFGNLSKILSCQIFLYQWNYLPFHRYRFIPIFLLGESHIKRFLIKNHIIKIWLNDNSFPYCATDLVVKFSRRQYSVAPRGPNYVTMLSPRENFIERNWFCPYFQMMHTTARDIITKGNKMCVY